MYEEYFGAQLMDQFRPGEFTRQALAYPLGIRCEGMNYWLLRNLRAFQPDGSLICSGEIPESSWMQLMISSRELTLEAAYLAAQKAIQSLNRVFCVFVFDSIARRKLLGEQDAAEEITRIKKAIGEDTPLAGYYTYGEHAPLANDGKYGHTTVQTGSVLIVAIGT